MSSEGGERCGEQKEIYCKIARKAAEKALRRDANCTTCLGIYQPKAPADMKKRHYSRGLTAFLVLVLLLSVMVTTAFADEAVVPYSNKDVYFFKEAPISSSFAQTGTASKDNSTPAWLRIDSMSNGTQVRVRIVGSALENHACSTSVYNFGEGDPTCSYCNRCTTKGSYKVLESVADEIYVINDGDIRKKL